jgi:2-hydroxyacylsphingosine 1-beta-galactosyltransferase
MTPIVSLLYATMTSALLLCTCPSDGARLLLIVDNMNSHVLLFSRLGLELAKLGHDVRLLAPSNARVPDEVREHRLQHHHHHQQQLQQLQDADGSSTIVAKFASGGRFNFTTFAVDGDTDHPYTSSLAFNNLISQSALTKSYIGRVLKGYSAIKALREDWERNCHQLVENQTVMDDLRSGGYQFVIVNPGRKVFVVPAVLQVPYGILSIGIIHSLYRIPRLPSFSAISGFDFGDRMTFFQRLLNFAFQTMGLLFFHHEPDLVYNNTGVVGSSSSSIAGAARAFSSSSSLSPAAAFQNASVWFLLEDVATGFSVPQMPNTVPVGDIMAGRPGRPLPSDLENFVDASTGGGNVIVVAFGSYFDHVPREITEKFCETFRRLPAGIRVVWKLKTSELCSGLEHVRTAPWIPQNDLLADSRVRLLISHGGMHSIMEAAYHAKPVILFPLYGDQSGNAAAAESRGFSICMDIGHFTSESLLENIERIFSDRKYELNAQRASSILRDRGDTPAERVSHIVDHVIKYGDSHLRTGAFELSLLQFWMLDIFAVVCSVFVTYVIVSWFFLRYVYGKFSRRIRAVKLRKTKSD